MEAGGPHGSSWTIVAAYRRHRFTGLFATLLLTLGAGATLDAVVPTYNPLEILLAVNLLAAIVSVSHEGAWRLTVGVGVAFAITRGALAVLGVPGMFAASQALWATAIVLAIVVAARHAFGRGAVDHERIMAALDGYLLAGLLFGVVYWALDRTWPGSLGGRVAVPLDLPDAIYFSFVTIATLGYGDVVPATAPARGLAMVEGVAGQFYLAVLVARLVGLYARQRGA